MKNEGKREAVVKTDEFYMRRALRLARGGERRVSPNPMVGAVIVKNGRIIGEGFHACCGENHAEVNAIERAVEDPSGAQFYVTLEPCCHQGRTPPCVERLIAIRPARVIVGTTDPNPLVSGRGIAALEAHGIETKVGVLEASCLALNERFFTFMRTGRPFVTLKFAQTLDGRIATRTGHSRWISSPPSLRFAHELRSTHDAILVGVGTVINDDPELTVRHVRGRNPLRVILDSTLRVPPSSRVLSARGDARTLIATLGDADPEKRRRLERAGVEVLTVPPDGTGRVSLPHLLGLLGERRISSVLIEGGAEVITRVLAARLADRLVVVVAPKIIGRGTEAVGDLGLDRMDQALLLTPRRLRRRGRDTIFEFTVEKNPQPV
ncbi:MAG TPA: bifunctional diaminohydroxyphosphoribosylaminopyrimidine deaminase/5-amino-6-(5-phosphoribosylamino)uracil reductase RibD [Syntrophus sp. (in: bacteria)]|nr:bifunctional diaminohydroxyphosphoribosylaminopyrimidine deaminase/5-amino-6-(5-phosphoribosylamino)uracil reductase RibD [Syntrophus sp. (in: bacteria)]